MLFINSTQINLTKYNPFKIQLTIKFNPINKHSNQSNPIQFKLNQTQPNLTQLQFNSTKYNLLKIQLTTKFNPIYIHSNQLNPT